MGKHKPVVTTAVARPAPSKLVASMSAQVFSRSEGAPVDWTPLKRQEDGATRYAVDLARAPVPQRRYVADIAALEYNGLEIKIIFGQTEQGSEDVDTILSIRFNLHAFVDLANVLHASIISELERIKLTMRLKEDSLSQIKNKPAHVAKVVANMGNYAIAGHETCLDFYHVNAFANAKAEGSSKLDVEAVVRVDLRTSLFLSLSYGIGQIAAQIAAEQQENNNG